MFGCEYSINGKWSAFQAEVMGSNPIVRKRSLCFFVASASGVFLFIEFFMGAVFYSIAIPTLVLIGLFYLCFGATKTLSIYFAYWLILTLLLYGRRESALASYGLTYVIVTLPIILCYIV